MASTLRGSVLVVDDQEPVRELIARILERRGIRSFQAATAADGLRLVHEHGAEIQLAIIDMVMPGVTGLDLAADLSREHPNLHILYISGYVQSIAVDVIARRSPQAVLLKPLDEATLMQRVNHFLGEFPGADIPNSNGAA